MYFDPQWELRFYIIALIVGFLHRFLWLVERDRRCVDGNIRLRLRGQIFRLSFLTCFSCHLDTLKITANTEIPGVNSLCPSREVSRWFVLFVVQLGLEGKCYK